MPCEELTDPRPGAVRVQSASMGLLKLQAATNHLQSQLPALPSMPTLPSSATAAAQLRAAQGVVAAYASRAAAAAAPLGEQRLLRALLALLIAYAVHWVLLRGARRRGWCLRFSLVSRGGTTTDDDTPTTAVVRPLTPYAPEPLWHGESGWALELGAWMCVLDCEHISW